MLLPACSPPEDPSTAPTAGKHQQIPAPRGLRPWILPRNARQLRGMVGFILTLKNGTNPTAVGVRILCLRLGGWLRLPGSLRIFVLHGFWGLFSSLRSGQAFAGSSREDPPLSSAPGAGRGIPGFQGLLWAGNSFGGVPEERAEPEPPRFGVGIKPCRGSWRCWEGGRMGIPVL